jgi:hypothetical protein
MGIATVHYLSMNARNGKIVPADAVILGPASTTLSAAITSTSATSITVTSASNIVNGTIILVGSERMLVTGVAGTTLTVTRGYNGTTAATALINAAVTGTTNEAFNLTGLNPSTLYSVIWGDAGTQGAITTASVNNKARTGTFATLTTAAAHGFVVGQTVTIAGVDAALNGTFVLASGTTGSTLKYHTAASGTIASAAVSPVGTAFVPLTDSTGAVTRTRTYTTAGTYTIQVIDQSGGDSNGNVAATVTITVV